MCQPLLVLLLRLYDLAAAKFIPHVGLDALAVHLDGLHAEDVPVVVPLGEDKPKTTKETRKAEKPVEAASRASGAENISPNLTEKPAAKRKPTEEERKFETEQTRAMSDFVSGVSGASIRYDKVDVIGDVKINGKDTAFTVSLGWPFYKGEPATAAQYRYDETDGYQWLKFEAAAKEWNKLDKEHTAEVYNGENSVNFRSLEEALSFEKWLDKRSLTTLTEAETAKPVAKTPKTDASASSASAAPVVEKRGDAATVGAPESVEAKIEAKVAPKPSKTSRQQSESEQWLNGQYGKLNDQGQKVRAYIESIVGKTFEHVGADGSRTVEKVLRVTPKGNVRLLQNIWEKNGRQSVENREYTQFASQARYNQDGWKEIAPQSQDRTEAPKEAIGTRSATKTAEDAPAAPSPLKPIVAAPTKVKSEERVKKLEDNLAAMFDDPRLDPDIKDLIEKLKQGERIRAAKSDAADLPDAWMPEAQKPLERVAHALRNVVTVGGKRLKVSFADRSADVDGQTRKSIGGVFTGSGADYEKPSLLKIGTGEGSQVYGWGLYGSTVRDVADGYAHQDAFRKGPKGQQLWQYVVDGKVSDLEEYAAKYGSGAKLAAKKIQGGYTPQEAIESAERFLKETSNPRFKKNAEDSIRFLREHTIEVQRNEAFHEHLYEQTFFTDRAPGDESHLLKWYEDLPKEQVEWIAQEFAKEGFFVASFSKLKGWTILDRTSGKKMSLWDKRESGETYEAIAKFLGSPQAASEFLARAGIDGVKYPVDSYGKTLKDGDVAGWNYVSFRDDNIRVDHKWTDGELRYMRNTDGVTVGEYDAAKGEIRLYPGAKVADVVHEFTHPLVDFARTEARAGRGELLGKINQIIDAERATWEQPVRDAYKDKSNETILEEIFTHAMGEKGADLFGKSTKTLQGRRWYNRLWEAIKGVWQDFATKMGWNKADLRGLERMSPEDAAQKILSEMAKGRSFGDAVTGGEGGVRNAVKNLFGFIDTSRGYTVAALKNDRPYLQKNNQAANGAFVDSGNAGGSRLDQRSVAAAHSSLEKISYSLQNPAPKVKGMVDSLLRVLGGMKSGKPVFDGGRPLTANELVLRKNASPYYAGVRFKKVADATPSPLTANSRNGIIPTVDHEKIASVIRGLVAGDLKHPRFTKEEVAASKGTEHEQLWHYILSLESPDVHSGGTEALGRGKGGADSQGGGRLGHLRRLATRYGSDPKEVAAKDHKYLDRGAESRVYLWNNDAVIKVRRLDAYDLDGVKHALAKIVYHNYLFPKDAYQLHDIAVWKNERGFDEYYMILEQPLVTPKTDADGNIIEPSQGHILQALKKTGQQFSVFGGYKDSGDTKDDSDTGDVVESAKMVAANGDYAVYDFKPGRNTFIDAETGEVRFIDPRVDINDPGAGFNYSKIGKRRNNPGAFKIDEQLAARQNAENGADESNWTAEDEARLREEEQNAAELESFEQSSPAETGEVDFDDPRLDADVNRGRTRALVELIKAYQDSGIRDFRSVAVRLSERFPEKFDRIMPYFREAWNIASPAFRYSEREADAIYARLGIPTSKNPLGQVVPPEDGSVAQSIDAEIAIDEAAAKAGAGRPQGIPPAPAPGSSANATLNPGYEPESIGAGVKNPIARQQIIDKFRELFPEVAIRGRNTTRLGPSVAGHYEQGAGIIRSKDPVSLRTIPHEIGHHIEFILKNYGPMRPANLRYDLIRLGKNLYGAKRPVGGYESEGFAELVKYYLQGNDAGLRRDAPVAYDWFVNDFGRMHPDTMARMDALRDLIDTFQNQSGEDAVRAIRAKDPSFAEMAVAKVRDMVLAIKPTQENWLDTGAFITKGMRASGIDKLYDWRDAMKRGDVAEMNDIIENHPVLKWKLYNGKAAARAYKALENGLTDLSGTRRYTYGDLGMATPGHNNDELIPTFKEIFGSFSREEMDEFENYAIARIAKEAYLDKGLEFGLTPKEVAPTLLKHVHNAKFRRALDLYTHYKHGVLHLLVDSGAMSQEQFETIVAANPIYVKIARRRESPDLFRDSMLKRKGKAVNKRTGSGRQVEDIFDAGLVDDERIFAAAFQADILRSLVAAGKRAETANIASTMGGAPAAYSVGANWLKEVPNAQGAVKFTAEKLRKQITDAMQKSGQAASKSDADNVFDALFDDGKDTLTIFKEKPSNGKNGLVSLYDEDGKLHTYELPEVNAEGWAKGLMGFTDATKPNILEQWAQIAAAATRSGATVLNPTFALRNIVKDTLHAATVNEFGIYFPGASTVQGIAMDLLNTNAKQLFDSMGIQMGSMLGEAKLQSARRANRYLMSRNWFEAQWNKGIKKVIADFVGFSENSSRIKEFKNVRDFMMKRGASEKAADMLAGCNALDITLDFQRGGETTKTINRWVPFFNASVQGLEQTARAFGLLRAKEWQREPNRLKRASRTVLQGAAYLTMLALISELFNRSDDDRKKKVAELKPHEKWNYISFGDVRIPVPYEIGYIFASIPRAVVAELYDGQDGAVKECLEMFRRTLPGLSPRDMALIGPALEAAMNESWTGRAIVPEHVMRSKRSYDWYDERTSEFSKRLARALHPIFGDSRWASPAHIDYVFNGITGNMFKRTIGGISDLAELDSTRPHTWPVVGTFFRNNATASRVVGDFYERKIELTRKKGSGEASPLEIAELSAAEKIADTLSKLRKRAEIARGDKFLSAKGRNDIIEQAALRMQEIARKHNAAFKAARERQKNQK